MPEFHKLPVDIRDTQAVLLESKVYIGGGNVLSGASNVLSSRLLIYSLAKNSWDMLRTPTKWFSLSTYHSQLVLVGGKDPTRMGSATNRLWVLDGQSHWTQPLPPMLTKCYGASAVSTGNHLIVAGGLSDEDPLDIVQVYNGHEWMRAQSLPKACYFIKCALDKDKKWYLAGGVDQGTKVFYASLESLTARPQRAESKVVWGILPDAPIERSTPVIFKMQLMAIGGVTGRLYSSAIHAYSRDTKKWVHMGDLPVPNGFVCTLALPNGQLLMAGGKTRTGISSHAFRTRIQGEHLSKMFSLLSLALLY